MWKEYKALIGLVIVLIPATVLATLYFAPRTYAEETRQIVMQFTDSQQLKWMQSELTEFEWNCMDKKTDEWICSEKKRVKYDTMILDTNILRLKLGLDPLETESEVQ